MLERILTARQAVLLSEERQCLRDLQATLARYGAKREDQQTLEGSIRQLDQLFLLVVVGEFNSGKSTFINALLANRLLEEGVTPTTQKIHLLSYGDEVESGVGDGGIREVQAPVELLRQVNIVDTPGTNALDREHETITREFVPRSDLVLFVTSADRPFTESERAFIESIRKWGKKLVMVVNKVDFLKSEQDRRKVVDFIADNGRQLLGFRPEIFTVSASQALEAKLAGDAAALERSRFPELERFLVETLDEGERVRLKLLNPLGVAQRMASSYRQVADNRDELLQDDFKTLEDIDLQLALYKKDLGVEFRYRLSDVDNELHEFEKRGQEYFDETLRIARALDLLNKSRLKADFERKVIADAPERIEKKVDEIIDWMVGAELKQWQTVSQHLARRQSHHPDQMMGDLGGFDYNRGQLLETVGRAAQDTVHSYDQRAEASRMAEGVQTAVAGTALMEVGALGLGTLFTLLATSQLADVTGILAASTLAVLGFFVLPAKRRRAKRELAGKILALRERLMGALTEQFDNEVERSGQRIQEAVSPYTRFVRAERHRITEMQETLGNSIGNIGRLKEMIDGLAAEGKSSS